MDATAQRHNLAAIAPRPRNRLQSLTACGGPPAFFAHLLRPGLGAGRLLAWCAVFCLSACGGTLVPPSPAARTTASVHGDQAAQPQSAESLLAAARRAESAEAAELALASASRAIDDGNFELADDALALAGDLPLSVVHAFSLELARAERAYAAGDTATALRIVRPLAGAPDNQLRRRAHLLRARIFAESGDFLAAVRERVQVAQLLANADQSANAEAIWQALSSMPLHAITESSARETDTSMQAWLRLAGLFHGNRGNAERAAAFRAWAAAPGNPIASGTLPAAVAALARERAPRPDSVALLLPASGPLATAAAALRDGFFAAALADTEGTPPRITIHDTSDGNALVAYEAARAGGADVIVGPLDRNGVIALNGGALAVPTLALNYLPANRPATANLFQFGLAPEDDANEVAERLHADGVERVMVFAVDAEWATRTAAAFTARFGELGGEVRRHTLVGELADVQRDVKDALLIAESESRRSMIARALGFSPEFQPRRRGDVEAVVLLADATASATLKPMLTYYYASDLPVYTTSHVRDTAARGAQATAADLDGVRFCDTPWRLGIDSRRDQMRALPAARGALANLFALGVDAYWLHARTGEIKDRSLGHRDGATGALTTADGSRVTRTPAWATIARGGVRAMPRVAAGLPSP